MLFKFCKAPATFQGDSIGRHGITKMHRVFHDILVIGGSFTDHMKNLYEVFQQLRELIGLCLEPRNSHPARGQVTYQGYNANGISADPRFPTHKVLHCHRVGILLPLFLMRKSV